MTRPILFSLVMLVIIFLVRPADAQKKSLDALSFQQWKPMGLSLSYYNVIPRKDGKIELWFDANLGQHNGVVGLSGPSLDQLDRSKPRHFDASIVKGYKAHLPDRKSPIVSRTTATRLKKGGYLILTQIGPAYRGGASELYPALFYSPTGKNGSFKHLGAPAGEPKAWLDEQRKKKKKIRGEGGAIIEMPDGTLRMYIQCYGVKMALATVKKPEGPWTFEKNADGSIRDLLKGAKGGWLFPHVMQIGEHGFMMTGADKWPPTEIHVAYSSDGLNFKVETQGGKNKALITPAQVIPGSKSMKTLRGAYNPKTGEFEAVVNIWNPQKRGYELMTSSAPFPLGVFKK